MKITRCDSCGRQETGSTYRPVGWLELEHDEDDNDDDLRSTVHACSWSCLAAYATNQAVAIEGRALGLEVDEGADIVNQPADDVMAMLHERALLVTAEARAAGQVLTLDVLGQHRLWPSGRRVGPLGYEDDHRRELFRTNDVWLFPEEWER